MADDEARSLAEQFLEGISEEELSKPICLEGVDQVFTLRTLLPTLNALRPLGTSPVQPMHEERRRRQGGSL